MTNRYANIPGASKINQSYNLITEGFDKVEQEMDAKPDASIAQVNDIAFDADDTLTVEGGTGITVTTIPGEKKMRIVATGEATPGAHAIEHITGGSDVIPNATTTSSGLMSASDKTRLDGAMLKTADSDLDMNNRAITNLLSLNMKTSGANLTISSDAITVTQGYHVVDTEGSAQTDNLTTINGGNTGDSLILRQANASRDITIKSGVGNIRTFDGLDIVMSTDNSMVELLKVGNNWVVKGYVPVHDQYPLPLAAGMTDYNTIDSGYACVIFRRGRMVTVIFMLTKDSGNFSGNELFATLPAGLRSAGRCKFSAALYNAPNPTQGTSTFVGMADGTVYIGGEMRVNPHSMTGNRIGGTVTFAI